MEILSESVNVDASGELAVGASATVTIGAGASVTMGAGSTMNGKQATAGWYPPQIAAASLPDASGVEGMIAYDTTNNKLVVSNGTAWETITSAT
jgi:hypothetical protein